MSFDLSLFDRTYSPKQPRKRSFLSDLRLEPTSLTRVDGGPHGRVYVKNGVEYPSVTNVLSVLPHPELDAWLARVGPEEAAKIQKRATDRGTLVHDAMESYVAGADPMKLVFNNASELMSFNTMRRAVDSYLDNVIAQEVFLVSEKLKMAGASDLVGNWCGVPSVIDYKTSDRLKNAEEVNSYWLQLTAYAFMLYEQYGHEVTQLVIVMAVNDLPHPTIMKRHIHIGDVVTLMNCREMFREVHGI